MSKKSTKLLVYALILILPLTLLLFSPQIFKPFKMKMVGGISLPLRILLFPFKEIKKIALYHVAYNRYTRLKEEVETLRSRLIGQEEILRENSRFRELLDFKESLVFSSLAASVIGRDPTNWNAAIIINRGERHGLKVGLPVVTALGIVGKVAEVGVSTSKVLLLNDLNFSVAAVVQRSRESGLVSGTLSGICRMRYLSRDADVSTGDRVITSKSSSSFPEGLLIGEVVSVHESQSSPTTECIVEPAVSLSQIEEVLIIFK